MQVDFVKMAKGDLQAIAKISPEQVAQIQADDKGATVIEVRATDESGNEPMQVSMEWALSKKRK